MTITEAIRLVMMKKGSPMTADEAYCAIVHADLYTFHADNPRHVVRSQIRRHCEGIVFPSSSATKYFVLVDGNRYIPVAERLPGLPREQLPKQTKIENNTDSHAASLRELQLLHEKYIVEFKKKILNDLKSMSPSGFELFAKRLMDIYGFHDTAVTKVSSDGGIDGHGKLKVGLANLNVAFQCKRWTKGNIQRPEIDRFRGAAQGDFEQGYFSPQHHFHQALCLHLLSVGRSPLFSLTESQLLN
ncbi:restriction endonuclease [Pseudomonas viridiflava]|uniref:restriction endonuclease n=1 Tax=Pseudomonas viridiflava TaxID=33069 RepID=UPI000F068216|nr:restriction endonuclease [Pseudomonas viridiflava]